MKLLMKNLTAKALPLVCWLFVGALAMTMADAAEAGTNSLYSPQPVITAEEGRAQTARIARTQREAQKWWKKALTLTQAEWAEEVMSLTAERLAEAEVAKEYIHPDICSIGVADGWGCRESVRFYVREGGLRWDEDVTLVGLRRRDEDVRRVNKQVVNRVANYMMGSPKLYQEREAKARIRQRVRRNEEKAIFFMWFIGIAAAVLIGFSFPWLDFFGWFRAAPDKFRRWRIRRRIMSDQRNVELEREVRAEMKEGRDNPAKPN